MSNLKELLSSSLKLPQVQGDVESLSDVESLHSLASSITSKCSSPLPLAEDLVAKLKYIDLSESDSDMSSHGRKSFVSRRGSDTSLGGKNPQQTTPKNPNPRKQKGSTPVSASSTIIDSPRCQLTGTVKEHLTRIITDEQILCYHLDPKSKYFAVYLACAQSMGTDTFANPFSECHSIDEVDQVISKMTSPPPGTEVFSQLISSENTSLGVGLVSQLRIIGSLNNMADFFHGVNVMGPFMLGEMMKSSKNQAMKVANQVAEFQDSLVRDIKNLQLSIQSFNGVSAKISQANMETTQKVAALMVKVDTAQAGPSRYATPPQAVEIIVLDFKPDELQIHKDATNPAGFRVKATKSNPKFMFELKLIKEWLVANAEKVLASFTTTGGCSLKNEVICNVMDGFTQEFLDLNFKR